MSDIKCRYVTLPTGKQVHYRHKGDGPPLIILHPSPQSSEAMLMAINAFAPVCACYALDTPGYGLSDPLAANAPEIGDYAEALMSAVTALGFERFFLYGSATGSQLAIEMAKRNPDRVAFVLLDANGHISQAYADALTEGGYFEDVYPQRGGGHLFTYREMCRQLFYAFPWMSGLEADRLGFDIPPADVIHQTLLRYLQAGENYTLAYKAALYTERRAHLDGMTVPAVMTRWDASPVLDLADALIEQGLPENVELLEAGHGFEARFKVQVDALRNAISEANLPTTESMVTPLKDVLQRMYLQSGPYQIHALANDRPDERPLVILHDGGQSISQVQSIVERLSLTRSVIAIDLPCHGASFDLPPESEFAVEAIAAHISQALKQTGIGEIDVLGFGFGGAIGAGISQIHQVNSLTLVDPIPYTQEERYDALTRGIEDLTPCDDGSYLAAAWALARNSAISWPHWSRQADDFRSGDIDLSPPSLHASTVDYLRVGARWQEVFKQQLALDWPSIFQGVASSKVQVMHTPTHPCTDRLSEYKSEEFKA